MNEGMPLNVLLFTYIPAWKTFKERKSFLIIFLGHSFSEFWKPHWEMRYSNGKNRKTNLFKK